MKGKGVYFIKLHNILLISAVTCCQMEMNFTAGRLAAKPELAAFDLSVSLVATSCHQACD